MLSILTVFPGRPEGPSPESIATAHEEKGASSAASCSVAPMFMDSGLFAPQSPGKTDAHAETAPC
jgi:hypothetical protein